MKIIDLFKSLGLPFGIIPYSECEILKPHLTEKSNISPETVIVLLVPYYSKPFENRNVSLYAVPKDYHIYFAGLFEKLTHKLKELYPENKFVGFADHSPINEVHAAAKAGLGAVGDNGLLINGDYGSYVFIGEILTDIPYSDDFGVVSTAETQCGHCGICKRSCPKSDKCLSSITQTKNITSEDEKKLIIENGCAWGCDICQTVCPMNLNIKTTDVDFFKEDLLPFVDSEMIRGMSEEEFGSRAYSWRGKNCILRNLSLLEDKGESNV